MRKVGGRWWWLPLAAFLIELIVLGIPQYFRYDDPGWLHLAKDHSRTPWDILSPGLDRSGYRGLGDYYRPAVGLLWTLLYALWGVNPLPYLLASGCLFAVSVFYLQAAARLLLGRLGGWIAVLFFLAFGPLYLHGIYRMGLLHLGQATLLASAYHLLRGARGSRAHLAAGVALGVISALSRQTGAVILPSVVVAYLAVDRGVALRRRQVVLLAIALLAASAVLLRLSPVSVGSADTSLVAHAWGRLAFYAHAILSGPGGWITIAVSLAALASVAARALRPDSPQRATLGRAVRWAPVLAPIIAQYEPLAAAVLVGGLASIARVHRAGALGLVWFLAGALPFLAFGVTYARYLEEALYGLSVCLAAGVMAWGTSVMRDGRIADWYQGRERALAALTALAVAILLPLGVRSPAGRRIGDALAFSRASATNVRAVVEYAATQLPPRATVFEPGVSTSELPTPEAREAASAAERATELPAMEPEDVDELLTVMDRPDVQVRRWPDRADSVWTTTQPSAFILGLNGAQLAEAAARPHVTWVRRFGTGAAAAGLLRFGN